MVIAYYLHVQQNIKVYRIFYRKITVKKNFKYHYFYIFIVKHKETYKCDDKRAKR